MKNALLLILGLLPNLVFSQSLIVMETGKVLTISSEGYHYDNGNFVLPYKIKHLGGNFLIDGRKSLNTVDENGIYYKLGDKKLPRLIKHTAENYFISKFGRIFTVNKAGNIFRGDKSKVYKKIKIKGGRFFVSETKKNNFELIVINDDGIILNVKVPFLDPSSIAQVGSNYFVTTTGELFTIDAKGFVYTTKHLGINFSGFIERGGNYLFNKNRLFTVSATGLLVEQNSQVIAASKRFMGTNFFITDDQRIHIVDKNGMIKTSDFPFDVSEVSRISKYE